MSILSDLITFDFRDQCKNEFIVPIGPELKELYADDEMKHSLRSLKYKSVLPQLKMTEIVYVYWHLW